MPYALLALIIALAAPLAGQGAGTSLPPATPPSTESIPSPSVAVFPLSRLRFVLKESEVTLTWEESAGYAGTVVLFRGKEAFSAESFPRAAKVAEIAPGTKKYMDRPPVSGEYWFAILPLAADGKPQVSFQNGRNATGNAIKVEVALQAAPVDPKIATHVDGDSVIVEYAGKADTGRLLLYRGTAAFTDATSLLAGSVVATVDPAGGRFVDYPVPGIDYWYALVAEDELKAGRIALKAGATATGSPIRIPAEVIGIGMARELPYSRTPPLPSFYLDMGISAASPQFAEPGGANPLRELSPETAKAVASLLAPYPLPQPTLPPLTLLAAERGKPSGGEDYALALIIHEKLVKGENRDAADQLRRYLSLNRGEDAQARARFYLGVCLSRLDSPRDAVFELLAARNSYPRETKPWLDYLMATLRLGD